MKQTRKGILAASALALAGALGLVTAGSVHPSRPASTDQTLQLASDSRPVTRAAPKDQVRFQLVPSSATLARCLPHAKVTVTVKLRTDATGRDVFLLDASGLPPKTSFTTFLLEVPGSPFGAAEYIGDVDTDKHGRAHAELRLIVEEAFASTLVNGHRVRAELNHVGMWFADEAADDFCFGAGGGPVTPFDGDDRAGAQVFNSTNALPGAPLP
jgi:hypothetical protein